MSNPASPDSKPAPETAPDAAPVVPPLEHRLHDFWQRNSRAVYIFCALVLLAILGKGALSHYMKARQEKVAAAYAAASTPEKLQAFAESHKSYELAGAAWLRLADEAYTAANYAQAAAHYGKAVATLKDPALSGRARLGQALATRQSGSKTDGEAQLKTYANDTALLKTVRAEALYHLASFAADAGRTDEARSLLDQLGALETGGLWAQRAMMLRASLPEPAVSTAAPAAENAPAAPTITFPSKP